MSRHILVIPLALLLAVSGGLATHAAPGPAPTPTSAPAPLCDGKAATIFGSSGTIKGTKGPDVIVGSSQSDVISGGGGADRICGGAGNDTIDGGSDNDRLFGESGDDHLKGGPGYDVLTDLVSEGYACLSDALGSTTTCFGSQRLEGGDGVDKIAGIGLLLGDTGEDAIALYFGEADGGPDDDFLRVWIPPTTIDGPIFRGGDGNDTIDADGGTDSTVTEVFGGPGTDTCLTDPNDVITGCEL